VKAIFVLAASYFIIFYTFYKVFLFKYPRDKDVFTLYSGLYGSGSNIAGLFSEQGALFYSHERLIRRYPFHSRMQFPSTLCDLIPSDDDIFLIHSSFI